MQKLFLCAILSMFLIACNDSGDSGGGGRVDDNNFNEEDVEDVVEQDKNVLNREGFSGTVSMIGGGMASPVHVQCANFGSEFSVLPDGNGRFVVPSLNLNEGAHPCVLFAEQDGVRMFGLTDGGGTSNITPFTTLAIKDAFERHSGLELVYLSETVNALQVAEDVDKTEADRLLKSYDEAAGRLLKFLDTASTLEPKFEIITGAFKLGDQSNYDSWLNAFAAALDAESLVFSDLLTNYDGTQNTFVSNIDVFIGDEGDDSDHTDNGQDEDSAGSTDDESNDEDSSGSTDEDEGEGNDGSDTIDDDKVEDGSSPDEGDVQDEFSSAVECLNPKLFKEGTTYKVNNRVFMPDTGYEYTTSTEASVVGVEAYNGQASAMRVDQIMKSFNDGFVIESVSKHYLELKGHTAFSYGYEVTSNETLTIQRTIPVAVVGENYSLQVGESYYQVYENITEMTFASGEVSSATGEVRQTKTYLGQEDVIVPAGVFKACKFRTEMEGTTVTHWISAHSGLTVKQVSESYLGAGSASIIELISASINGKSINDNSIEY